MLGQIERLCKMELNVKIFIKAINEHAISLINYYVGLLKLEPNDFKTLNANIKHVMNEFGMQGKATFARERDRA
ncbi:hypothetical protein PAEPH01_1280 [Pancytospora epiphaga]|nr:hypothetical protein PAEPH01_1280 [Pancytospora epiphaga]